MSKKYDLSFSEVIRIFLCIELGKMISIAYPNHDHSLVYNESEKIVQRKIMVILSLWKNYIQLYLDSILKPEKLQIYGTKKKKRFLKRRSQKNLLNF